MNTNINKIAEELTKLSIGEVAELLKLLSESMGIDLNQLLSASSQSAQPEAESNAQSNEKKKFVVKLVGFDKSKQMDMIRAVKNLKAVTLLEAKNQIGALPLALKGDLLEKEVEDFKKEWEAIGAQLKVEEDA